MILDGNNRLIQVRCLDKDTTGQYVPQLLIEKESGKPVYNYRYIRFVCTGYYDNDRSDPIIQFSKLQFFSDDGRIFDYGTNRIAKTYKSQITTFSGESLENVLTNTTSTTGFSKLCGHYLHTPIYFDIDLLSERLNLKKYNNWRFYYSNDSATEGYNANGPRRITHFTLQVKNDDMTEWKTVDDHSNTEEKTVTSEPENWKLAYQGKIKLY